MSAESLSRSPGALCVPIGCRLDGNLPESDYKTNESRPDVAIVSLTEERLIGVSKAVGFGVDSISEESSSTVEIISPTVSDRCSTWCISLCLFREYCEQRN